MVCVEPLKIEIHRRASLSRNSQPPLNGQHLSASNFPHFLHNLRSSESKSCDLECRPDRTKEAGELSTSASVQDLGSSKHNLFHQSKSPASCTSQWASTAVIHQSIYREAHFTETTSPILSSTFQFHNLTTSTTCTSKRPVTLTDSCDS